MDPRYVVYKMYRKAIEKKYEDESNREFFEELGKMMDADMPEFKRQYEEETLIEGREIAIQKSFTPEQQDFICWQIGEWYLMMKPLLEGSHNLGLMKEKLKTMICGDGDE